MFSPTTKVMTVGDSTIAGGVIPDPRYRYPQRLGMLLGGSYVNTADHIRVVDKASGGQTLCAIGAGAATSLLAKMDEYLNEHPDTTTVVMGIGINDLWTPGLTDGKWTATYVDVVIKVLNRGMRIIPCTMTPFGAAHPSFTGLNARRLALNNWIKSYWGESTVVDHGAILGGTSLETRFDSGDKLHPNREGTMRMADSMRWDRIV